MKKSDYWVVDTKCLSDGNVEVFTRYGLSLARGIRRLNYFIVKPPGWLGRSLGITHMDKIDAAIRQCQKWCDNANKRLEYKHKMEEELSKQRNSMSLGDVFADYVKHSEKEREQKSQ
tara:strand:+ start:4266 stop:4616 length:351 start_codon:yes stop_codon:yes gene_type:complete